jgi:hypothetical protein
MGFRKGLRAMTRLQSLRHWNKLKKRAANAPHGMKRVREEMLKRATHDLLREFVNSKSAA